MRAEPFESMAVFIELPLLQRAMEEIFGEEAAQAQLRDISAFTDEALNTLMERLREELLRWRASPLFRARDCPGDRHPSGAELRGDGQGSVQRESSVAGFQASSDHGLDGRSISRKSSDLDRAGGAGGLSKIFTLTGFSRARRECRPRGITSRYGWMEARRLLRETKRGVVDVALDVGYTNPSHFAQAFRKETGTSPERLPAAEVARFRAIRQQVEQDLVRRRGERGLGRYLYAKNVNLGKSGPGGFRRSGSDLYGDELFLWSTQGQTGDDLPATDRCGAGCYFLRHGRGLWAVHEWRQLVGARRCRRCATKS